MLYLINYVLNRPKNLDLHVEIVSFTWCLCNLCHLFFQTCVLQVKILKQMIYLGVLVMLTWSMIKLRRKHYLNILFIWEYRVGFVLFLRKNYKMFQNRKQEVSVEDMLWNNVFWCTLKFVVFPKILNSRYLYLYFWQPSKMIAQHIIIIFSQIFL